MENLYGSYKQIVERAIALGLLSEESKANYLSALDDDLAVSSCSEARNLHERGPEPLYCKTEDSQHSSAAAKSYKSKPLMRPVVDFEENIECSADEILVLDRIPETDRESIENYSILDVKKCHNTEDREDDDESDLSSFLRRACEVSSNSRRFSSTYNQKNLRKKPRKNEVVDFHIPIYVDMKKKSISIKPSKLKSDRYLHKKTQNNDESKRLKNMDNNKERRNTPSINKWAFKPSRPNRYTRNVTRLNLSQKGDINCPSVSGRYLSGIKEEKLRCQCCNSETASDMLVHSNCYQKSLHGVNRMIPIFEEDVHHYAYAKPNRKTVDPIVKEKKNLMDSIKQSQRRTCQKEELENSTCESEKAAIGNSNATQSPFFQTSNYAYVSKDCATFHTNDICDFKTVKVRTQPSREEIATPSENISSVESSDTQCMRKHGNEKMFNVNIFCQFYPNDGPTDRQGQDASSLDSSLISEQAEPKEAINIGSEPGPAKEKNKRRMAVNFLTKFFSRPKVQP